MEEPTESTDKIDPEGESPPHTGEAEGVDAAEPPETIKYFNLKSSTSMSRSMSNDDEAHEREKRKHFNQLGSATFVGGGATSPPSSSSGGPVTPSAGGRGGGLLQRRRTHAVGAAAGHLTPLHQHSTSGITASASVDALHLAGPGIPPTRPRHPAGATDTPARPASMPRRSLVGALFPAAAVEEKGEGPVAEVGIAGPKSEGLQAEPAPAALTPAAYSNTTAGTEQVASSSINITSTVKNEVEAEGSTRQHQPTTKESISRSDSSGDSAVRALPPTPTPAPPSSTTTTTVAEPTPAPAPGTPAPQESSHMRTPEKAQQSSPQPEQRENRTTPSASAQPSPSPATAPAPTASPTEATTTSPGGSTPTNNNNSSGDNGVSPASAAVIQSHSSAGSPQQQQLESRLSSSQPSTASPPAWSLGASRRRSYAGPATSGSSLSSSGGSVGGMSSTSTSASSSRPIMPSASMAAAYCVPRSMVGGSGGSGGGGSGSGNGAGASSSPVAVVRSVPQSSSSGSGSGGGGGSVGTSSGSSATDGGDSMNTATAAGSHAERAKALVAVGSVKDRIRKFEGLAHQH